MAFADLLVGDITGEEPVARSGRFGGLKSGKEIENGHYEISYGTFGWFFYHPYKLDSTPLPSITSYDPELRTLSQASALQTYVHKKALRLTS
jgi:hypothetical protein